ncbi:MAG: DUF3144 domain-containing protein [Bacteroidetes bacterium]|uniref:DUF3144 domain-containing protein n=1 Tax=Phaeocystidibacter marisrubri TaxID=1577780 RepID=A0A6L3ZJ86_9FLAO|nr:DUF3144 domain-containing protein [Phaeocystidibacter marisrubri]KAB2818076.1 DUF3144 domain-containing protein [Phaeocystidibacter marisrubri]TNE27295.1 MAG: DUF3144 domain-containing protein [Bacteroidota bacterium]GGH72067.1 hypothetical protein GCM10011318_15670 [Phaeocystidibacter marisrubri]
MSQKLRNGELDDNFFNRVDDHINLSNEQLKYETRGRVSASMMYSVARYNAWVSACGWSNAEEMKSAKEETLQYFVDEYRKMLNENLDDYIENFESYMKY